MNTINLPEVTVTSKKLIIDPISTSYGGSLISKDFEELPVDRNYKNIATLLPQSNTSYYGDEPNIGGATGNENKYYVDGIELTRVLKEDEKTSHIPIIILTAKSGQENLLGGLQVGADEYLTKPFDMKELEVRISNLIRLRKKIQDKILKGELSELKGEKKLGVLDSKFITKVNEVIEKHLSDENFSIEEFGKEIGMSRSQFHRKLKALVGKSASLYLRSVRLNRAKKMLEEGRGNISEISYETGFSSPSDFTFVLKKSLAIRQVRFIEN